MTQQEQLIYWHFRCQLAEKFIEESPCDPDVTAPQLAAYQAWNRSKDFGIEAGTVVPLSEMEEIKNHIEKAIKAFVDLGYPNHSSKGWLDWVAVQFEGYIKSAR